MLPLSGLLRTPAMYSFPLSYITPAIAIVVTVTLLALTLDHPHLNGYGATDPFAWHAAFMIVGFCLLMPLGVLSYVMDFGRRGNAMFPSWDSRRTLHGMLLFFSTACILIGFAIAFTCHERGCGPHKIQPHLPWTWEPDANYPSVRSAHVIIGYIVVAITVLQAGVGLYKAVALTKTGSRVFLLHSASATCKRGPSCHACPPPPFNTSEQQKMGFTLLPPPLPLSPLPGTLGPLVWVLGLTNICIAGFIEYLEKYENPPKVAWNATQTAVITLSLAALLVSTLLHLRCGNKRHLEADLRGSGGLLSGEEDEEDNSFAR